MSMCIICFSQNSPPHLQLYYINLIFLLQKEQRNIQIYLIYLIFKLIKFILNINYIMST